MKLLYNERSTKDFLWITVLSSVKMNRWPRSLSSSTTRTGDNRSHVLLYIDNLPLYHVSRSSLWRPVSRWTRVSRHQNVSILDFIGAKYDEGGEWWQLEL